MSAVLAGASKGWRFPASRKYLWDRTAADAQVLVELQEFLPRMRAAGSVIQAVLQAAAHRSSHAQLKAAVHVSSSYQVSLHLQADDPLTGPPLSGDEINVTCTISGQQPDVAALRATVQSQLDQKDGASVTQLAAVACSATANTDTQQVHMSAALVLPATSLLVTPLYAKRLCSTQLSRELMSGQQAPWQTGYLTMDQARSLLPLLAADTSVYSTPLVGVWVRGPAAPLQPLVACACLKFYYSSVLLDRVVQPDGSFLLLLCSEGSSLPTCYEVRPMHEHQLPLAAYRLAIPHDPLAHRQPGSSGADAGVWLPDTHAPLSLPATLRLPGGLLAAGDGWNGRSAGAAGSPPQLAPQSPARQRLHFLGAAPLLGARARDEEAEPRPSPPLKPYAAGSPASSLQLEPDVLAGGAQLLHIPSPRIAAGWAQEGGSFAGSPRSLPAGRWSERHDAALHDGLEGMGQQAAAAAAALREAAAAAAGGSCCSAAGALPVPHGDGAGTTAAAEQARLQEQRMSPHRLFAFPHGSSVGAAAARVSLGAHSVSSANSSGPRMGSPVRAAASARLGGSSLGPLASSAVAEGPGTPAARALAAAADAAGGVDLYGELGVPGPASLQLKLARQRPGSPAVAADAALSNLALLQRLNRGGGDGAAEGQRPGSSPGLWMPQPAAGISTQIRGSAGSYARPLSAPEVYEQGSFSTALTGSPVPHHVMRQHQLQDRMRDSLDQGSHAASKAAAALCTAECLVSRQAAALAAQWSGGPQEAGEQLRLPLQRPDPLRRSLELGSRAVHMAAAALSSTEHFVHGSQHAAAAAMLAADHALQHQQSLEPAPLAGWLVAPEMRSSLPPMLAASDGRPLDSPVHSLRPLQRLPTDPLRQSLQQGAGTVTSAADALAAAAHALGGLAPAQLQQEISFGLAQQAGGAYPQPDMPHSMYSQYTLTSGGTAGASTAAPGPAAGSVVIGVPVGYPAPMAANRHLQPSNYDGSGVGAWSPAFGLALTAAPLPVAAPAPGEALPDQQARALQLEVEALKAELHIVQQQLRNASKVRSSLTMHPAWMGSSSSLPSAQQPAAPAHATPQRLEQAPAPVASLLPAVGEPTQQQGTTHVAAMQQPAGAMQQHVGAGEQRLPPALQPCRRAAAAYDAPAGAAAAKATAAASPHASGWAAGVQLVSPSKRAGRSSPVHPALRQPASPTAGAAAGDVQAGKPARAVARPLVHPAIRPVAPAAAGAMEETTAGMQQPSSADAPSTHTVGAGSAAAAEAAVVPEAGVMHAAAVMPAPPAAAPALAAPEPGAAQAAAPAASACALLEEQQAPAPPGEAPLGQQKSLLLAPACSATEQALQQQTSGLAEAPAAVASSSTLAPGRAGGNARDHGGLSAPLEGTSPDKPTRHGTSAVTSPMRASGGRMAWLRRSGVGMRGSADSLGGSSAGGRAPARDVVRVNFTPLSDESDASDGESDAELMRKYGIRV